MKKSGLNIGMEQWGGIVASIYRAAIEPDHWSLALLDINQPIDCHLGHLVDISGNSAINYHNTTQGLVPDAIEDFDAEMQQGIQPRINYSKKQPAMTFFTDDMFISNREMRTHPFYCGSGSKYDIYYAGNYILAQAPERFAGIASCRAKSQGPLSTDERHYLQMVGPHVQRSLELMRVNRIQRLTDCITGHLEEFSTGVIALDSQAQITGYNRKAAEIIKRRDGIQDFGKKITLNDSLAQKQLNRDLSALLVGRDSTISTTTRYISVKRTPNTHPYHLLVVPFTSRTDLLANLSGLVCIVDPDEKKPQIKNLLKELFGLTPAEVELTEALCNNVTLIEFAEKRSISKETPRYHLKHIFEKTGTKRQSELVLLVTTKIYKMMRLHEVSREV
jgi:DNA-binding CsgD family transcriptional regulator